AARDRCRQARAEAAERRLKGARRSMPPPRRKARWDAPPASGAWAFSSARKVTRANDVMGLLAPLRNFSTGEPDVICRLTPPAGFSTGPARSPQAPWSDPARRRQGPAAGRAVSLAAPRRLKNGP